MFRAIYQRLWHDPKIKKLGGLEQRLFIYLITNEHTHVSGIYYLPIPLIVHELGQEEEVTRHQLFTLEGQGLIMRDAERDFIWVVNMFRYQTGFGKLKNPKNLKAAANQLDTLGPCVLIDCFLKYYEDLDIPYHPPIERPSIPDRTPIDTLSNNRYRDRDRDRDRRILKKESSCPLKADTEKGLKPEALSLCQGLAALIKKRDPKATLPNSFNPKRGWGYSARLLLDRDKRPYTEVMQVMAWSQEDEFWQNNILSTTKLRKHFTALYHKWRQSDGRGRKTNRTNQRRDRNPDEEAGKFDDPRFK